jgi:dephospho-CoA kinase
MGSGKSRVAQLLAKRGATVIDADSVGHALLDQGPVQETLVRKFGTDILGPDLGDGTRQIDRRALGAIVFANEDARKALEESLHPRMRTTFERVISRLSRQVSPKPGALRLPPPIVVLDAAVLYEAGWNDLCDMVVFVDAPRKDRIKRVKLQRDWTPDEMDRREVAQWALQAAQRAKLGFRFLTGRALRTRAARPIARACARRSHPWYNVPHRAMLKGGRRVTKGVTQGPSARRNAASSSQRLWARKTRRACVSARMGAAGQLRGTRGAANSAPGSWRRPA